MTNFDGIAEENNIRALLAGLTTTGGRVFDDAPDSADVTVDTYGRVAPYVVASFGVPFRNSAKGNKSYADTERTIPYTMTMVFGVYAGDKESLNAAYQEVVSALVGFMPNGNNAAPLEIPYAYNQKTATTTRPTIFGKVMTVLTTINLSPSE